MKKLIFVVFLSCLFFSACGMKQDTAFQKATITGPDLRMCACCGGWFITIGEKPYRFYKLPAGSQLNLKNAEFPLKVDVAWEKNKKGCKGDEIFIEKIKKRKDKFP